MAARGAVAVTPETWARLQDLFDQVMDQPPADRPAFLNRLVESLADTPDGVTLGRDLRRLVEHSEPSSQFLRPLAVEPLPSAFQPGDQIAGRFEIRRILGEGGMGQVYVAWDRNLQEQVALKFIRPQMENDAGHLRRFQREVQMARRVSHPNICRIHDWGESDGIPFLSMEFVEGETLASMLSRGPLTQPQWIRLAEQLFAGLHAAHAVGVVHRDLKPSNLMLSGDRWVVLDFGLAKPLDVPVNGALTNAPVLVGTLDWMAPEQLKGEAVAASDLYSAALILLAAFQGSLPKEWQGGISGAFTRATTRDLTTRIPAAIPQPWRKIISQCLASEPTERIQSAEEVLERVHQQGILPARIRINRRVAAIVAAVVAVMALSLFTYRYLSNAKVTPGATIMVATTVNSTANPDFAGLTPSLEASLGQSSLFNVWDRRRLTQAQTAIRHDPNQPVRPEDWRQIAFREHASALVFTTVSPLGAGYSLGIQFEFVGASPDQPTRTLAHTVTAANASRVPDMVHEAAVWIRSNAGEAEQSIAARNRLPQDITTSNWQALALFDQASMLNGQGKAAEAIAMLRRAVDLDPKFAMGLMRLGDILVSQRQSREGMEFWRRAIAQAREQHLSERERLIMESRYALELGDTTAAEPILRQWVASFPNDPRALEWLIAGLFPMGRYPEVISLARQQRKTVGPNLIGSTRIIQSLGLTGRLDEIEPEIPILRSVSELWALRMQGTLQAVRGQYAAAQATLLGVRERFKGQERSRETSTLAALAADQGNLEQARDLLKSGIEEDLQLGEIGLAGQKASALAFVHWMTGHPEDARTWALEAVRMLPTSLIVAQSASILARSGFVADAEKVFSQMPEGEGPTHTARVLRATGEIQAARHDPGAIETLERASKADAVYHPREYLAYHLKQAGRTGEARLAYSAITDRPWMVWLQPESEWPGLRYLAQKQLQSN